MRKKQRIYKKIIYQTISTFSKTIDAKDSYTKGHSKRVALYSAGIAKRLGFSKDEVERVYLIAILHDIGKIAVADHILRKPDKLNAEELEIMKNHSVESGKILSNFTSIKDISLCVRHHHERYDGKGYPDGLKGEEIPLISRIIAVADSFDAMTSKRCYRDILPLSYVLNELELNKGSQFDPELTDIMIDMINDGYVEFVLTLPMN
jgi:HD-GYP domain-containing protein (c-di-GMP phosphodiesterase class II)